jgi:chaperonin cofactor prefoldin
MYNESPQTAGGPLDCAKSNRAPSAREQLNRRKTDLETQLEDVNAAIAALNEHPEVEKVLTLVGRTVRF